MVKSSSNFYYFIEDLDVTDDKIPDGVLVRQLKINKDTGMYEYTKNCYITANNLKKIIDDVILPYDNNSKKLIKTILVSHNKLNKIRNKHIPIDKIPHVVICKTSHFAHFIKDKNININKLLIDLKKIVG